MKFVLELVLAFAAPMAWCASPPATRIDLAKQTRNADFSQADFTKPFKSGTALPALCSVSEVFFKTDEAPGKNIYLCGSSNIWTGLPDTVGGLSNCTVWIVSGTAQLASGCSAAFANQPARTLLSPGVVHPTAGDGVILFYFLNNAFVAGFDVTADCSGGIVCQAQTSSYPQGSLPFARVTVTAGVPVSVTDDRAWRTSSLVAGSGIKLDYQSGTQIISVNAGLTYPPYSGNGINVTSTGSAFSFDADCLMVGCLGTQNVWSGAQAFTGIFDASSAVSYRPRVVTGVLPSSCSTGEIVFKADAAAGQNVYGCTLQDVWTLQSGAPPTRHTAQIFFPALIGSQPTGSFVYSWRIPDSGGAIGTARGTSSINTFAALRFLNGQTNLAFLPFFRLPDNWDATQDLTITVDHHVNLDQGGDVTLEFRIACLDPGSSLTSPVVNSSGNIAFTIPTGRASDLDRITHSLPKTGCLPGSLVNISIARHGADPSDTYLDDLFLLGATIQWKEFVQ
jgi:hypothetical protein